MTENYPPEGPKIETKMSQNIIKILIVFGHAFCVARGKVVLVVRESGPCSLGREPPPGRRPRGSGRAAKRHGTGPQAPMRAVKDIKHYTNIQNIQYTLYSIQCKVYSVKYRWVESMG